jgi:D-alanine-D-alanine ligase
MSGSDIVILFGGSSSERRVSVASAKNVASVLPEAEAWFLATSGTVHRTEAATLQAFDRPFERDFDPEAPPEWPSVQACLTSKRVFFLALHGGEGEDGTIQRICEQQRIAFTGPGADASAKAFDKEVAKQEVSADGVRIAQSVHLPSRPDVMRKVMHELLEVHGRIVAKPVAGGSSVGLHHVATRDEVETAAQAIAMTGEPYLAEEFVAGVELTVGVVDSEEDSRALPPSEVRMDPGRAFDYDGKYLGKGTLELTPAEVAPEVTRAAQELALAAHRALGCEGYSRTDLIVGRQGPVFLELNTLPGLTARSFIPQQLAAEGTSLRAFLDGQLALARGRRDRTDLRRRPR